MNNATAMNERQARIDAAIRCEPADKVPFCVNTNDYYSLGYGVSIYDTMKDARFLKEPIQKFVQELNPDWVMLPVVYPMDALDLVGAKHFRYPGPTWNLPVDTPYQYMDGCYLEEDDYDDYLKNPADYLFRNVFLKKYETFSALGHVDVTGLVNNIYGLAVFAAPPIQEALKKLMQTGEIINNYLGQIGQLDVMIQEMGYPTYGAAAGLTAFDAYADGVRGILDASMDVITCPDELKKVLDVWTKKSIPSALGLAARTHSKTVFIPLHCGGEMFMSVDNFEEFYWPYLKQIIEACVSKGITPVVFCEGSYTSRLEILADVTPGKVVYLFENVDLKKAKEILGGKACIMGGIKTQTLMYGTVEDVIEETKQVLEICMPGGGFIMSNGIALDTAPKENLEAWRETVEQYGKY